jgi:hypothetical protein
MAKSVRANSKKKNRRTLRNLKGFKKFERSRLEKTVSRLTAVYEASKRNAGADVSKSVPRVEPLLFPQAPSAADVARDTAMMQMAVTVEQDDEPGRRRGGEGKLSKKERRRVQNAGRKKAPKVKV